MKNGAGEIMETVGYEPWTVSISAIDAKLTGTSGVSMEGTTSTEFVHGDGRAIFDNVIISGDIESTKFKFTITSGDGTVDSITSDTVVFRSPVSRGPCEEVEGISFDKKSSWDSDCSHVCHLPCSDLSSITAVRPVCNSVATCDSSTFSTCTDNGCECDSTELPSEINYLDYANTVCTVTGMELRLNKCAANAVNTLRLKDMYLDGAGPLSDTTQLDSTVENNCRGSVAYVSGPEYVFKLSNSYADCNTHRSVVGNTVTYTNSVQGYPTAKVFLSLS